MQSVPIKVYTDELFLQIKEITFFVYCSTGSMARISFLFEKKRNSIKVLFAEFDLCRIKIHTAV